MTVVSGFTSRSQDRKKKVITYVYIRKRIARLTQRQKRMVNNSKAKEGSGRIPKTHAMHT